MAGRSMLHRLLQLLYALLCIVATASGFQSPLVAARRSLSVKQTVMHLATEPLKDPSAEESQQSILQVIDRAGLSLKPKAYRASEQANLADKRSKKALFLAKTCLYYTMFIFYRAYRGIFVILPVVFRQVYQKLGNAVESPFIDSVGKDDVNPATGRVRLRTRITVSILASLVTLSYVIQGAFRVIMMFFRNLSKTSDVSGSFAAAAMEQEANERNLQRMARPDDLLNGVPMDDLKP
ncbi:hypothetical protein MPSEU_000129000 [Mayamaea pseudoterrestris]|nr:hypothetical protein MPSEU_000129000 [Mayamaea pseudoterrestris]